MGSSKKGTSRSLMGKRVASSKRKGRHVKVAYSATIKGALTGKERSQSGAAIATLAMVEDESTAGDDESAGITEDRTVDFCASTIAGTTWVDWIGVGWYEALRDVCESASLQKTLASVEAERQKKKIFPPRELLFAAFRLTPLEEAKVVIVGQDPYHKEGQAMGLSFSVPRGVTIPPSLRNIYREIDPLNPIPHGDLTHWATQGVLLLNCILTVEEGKAGSHKKLKWEYFTDAVIATLSRKRQGLVFMLWGEYAKQKKALINQQQESPMRHLVLEARHPSPLAAARKTPIESDLAMSDDFKGCNHFNLANSFLTEMGKTPIEWRLPSS